MNCPGRRHRQRMHVRSFPRRPRETSRQINLICARLLMSPENPAAAPNGGSGSRSVGQRKSRNVARHPIRLTAVSLPTLRGTQWSSARPQEHADRAVLCSVQVHDARRLSGSRAGRLARLDLRGDPKRRPAGGIVIMTVVSARTRPRGRPSAAAPCSLARNGRQSWYPFGTLRGGEIPVSFGCPPGEGRQPRCGWCGGAQTRGGGEDGTNVPGKRVRRIWPGVPACAR
jgi:hypothetical protein